jgi:predicted Holliday junction resolvase-like endonuclease
MFSFFYKSFCILLLIVGIHFIWNRFNTREIKRSTEKYKDVLEEIKREEIKREETKREETESLWDNQEMEQKIETELMDFFTKDVAKRSLVVRLRSET